MERTPADKLSKQEIEARLHQASGWNFDEQNTRIEKTFTRKNFLDATAFIQEIAKIAEAQDHHPDLLLFDYKKLKVMLTTHSAGGVTVNDFDLGTAIDGIA